MTEIKIELAPALFAKYGDRLKAAAVRGVYSAALRGVQDIVGRIIPSKVPVPFDRGPYKAGWKALPEPEGASITNPEVHALFIEEGVRASNVKIGRAMIFALAAWASRKGLVTKGKPEDVAWAIAKNMKKRGIFNGGKGFHVLGELMDNYLNAYIEEEVAAEIAREGLT